MSGTLFLGKPRSSLSTDYDALQPRRLRRQLQELVRPLPTVSSRIHALQEYTPHLLPSSNSGSRPDFKGGRP